MKEGVMGFSKGLLIRCVRGRVLWLALAGMLVSPNLMRAQSGQTVTVDQATMQALLKRIDQLEARVQQLESAQHPAAAQPANAEARQQQSADAPTHGPSQEGAQEHEPEPSEHAEAERMDVSKTLLRVRGFGDVTFHGDNYHPAGLPGDKTAFTLGQLNLFVTSDISDKFKFLSEIVFEAGPDNIYGVTRGTANTFGVDVERYLLTYSRNEYFNLSAGRYHTAIGYYNTAFHHSTWLQTTTGRPLLFAFEDQGGILPIHNVGVEAYGSIPSGSLGLHYVAEVGNGRESRAPIDEELVQNIVTETNGKAVNFELFARPTKLPGLQVGLSAYHDKLVPNNLPAVGETILAAHAVYTTPTFEWLNEALVVRHSPDGGHTYETPGWYSQISRRFGSYRPYFRYQYINASPNEPIFPDIGLRAGPSVGLRYDASESVALKLQYDFTSLRDQHSVQGLQAQVGFTF
jgi:ribosomal protein L12E/L44/L45/RPP1/RPP2